MVFVVLLLLGAAPHVQHVRVFRLLDAGFARLKVVY